MVDEYDIFDPIEEEFGPTAEVFPIVVDLCQDKNHTAHIIAKHGLESSIMVKLQSLGIRGLDCRDQNAGSSLMFHIGRHQQLRICRDKDILERPHIPHMLPPIKRWSLSQEHHIWAEVMPKVKVNADYSQGEGPVTQEHVDELIASLMALERPRLFWDAKRDNVGLLRDGTPVIVDPGATVSARKMAITPVEVIHADQKTESRLATFGKIIAHRHKFQAVIPQASSDIGITHNLFGQWQTDLLPEFGNKYLAAVKQRKYPKRDYVRAVSEHMEAYNLRVGDIAGLVTEQEWDKVKGKLGDDKTSKSLEVMIEQRGFYPYQLPPDERALLEQHLGREFTLEDSKTGEIYGRLNWRERAKDGPEGEMER